MQDAGHAPLLDVVRSHGHLMNLYVYKWVVHLKPVIHSTSLHNKIPADTPLEHAYTSASALERDTNFCVLEAKTSSKGFCSARNRSSAGPIAGPVTVSKNFHNAFTWNCSAVAMKKSIGSVATSKICRCLHDMPDRRQDASRTVKLFTEGCVE